VALTRVAAGQDGGWSGWRPGRYRVEMAAGLAIVGRVKDDALLAGYLGVIREIYGDTGSGGQPRLEHGQFHDVLVTGDVVYRFPRDEDSRRQLARRTEVLAALARVQLPVAVPSPVSAVDPGLPLGRSHAVLQRLPGEPLFLDQVRGPDAQAIAAQLAGLLDALQRAGADPAVAAMVSPADPGRWRQFAADVAEVLFPLMSEHGRHRAAAELRDVQALDPAGAALVHEDLGGSNLLWDLAGRQPQLTGVIDWDGAYLGSQATDLGALAVSYGWSVAERVDALRHRGLRPGIWPARAIAATFALQQALPAALSGDAAMLADGLAGYASQVPADGR